MPTLALPPVAFDVLGPVTAETLPTLALPPVAFDVLDPAVKEILPIPVGVTVVVSPVSSANVPVENRNNPVTINIFEKLLILNLTSFK